MIEHVLTTVDNPFDPLINFDAWNAYDMAMGYNTLSYLARVVKSSHSLSDADQSLAIEQGIDEILREDVFGIYIRIEIPNERVDSVA